MKKNSKSAKSLEISKKNIKEICEIVERNYAGPTVIGYLNLKKYFMKGFLPALAWVVLMILLALQYSMTPPVTGSERIQTFAIFIAAFGIGLRILPYAGREIDIRDIIRINFENIIKKYSDSTKFENSQNLLYLKYILVVKCTNPYLNLKENYKIVVDNINEGDILQKICII